MAEHDLWNEEDFFEKLKKEKKAAETPQSAEPTPEPEQESSALPLENEPEALESDLFEKQEMSDSQEQSLEEDIFFNASQEEASPSAPPEIAQDFDEEENPQEPVLEESEQAEEEASYPEPSAEAEEEAEAEPAPKKYALSDNYEDEKLAPVNYKPVIIGALVVILIIVLFFVLRGFIFKEKAPKETQPTAQQTTTQQNASQKTQAENPLQIKQKQFLAQLAGANAYNLGLITAIRKSVTSKDAQLTSLLLYNDELTFEMHCKNREVLAGVTVKLRNVSEFTNLKLISTNEWPGGAIDAVFYLKISGGSQQGILGAKLEDVGALRQWLGVVARQFKVDISAFRKTESASADLGLSRMRVVLQGVGSYRGVLDFINAIAAANRNVKVHKLVLTSLSQKNFLKSKYRIELTLDLFK